MEQLQARHKVEGALQPDTWKEGRLREAHERMNRQAALIRTLTNCRKGAVVIQ
jgi:hypothetical protein